MIVTYKNCEIDVHRGLTITGDDHLFFSVFDENGFEVRSGYTEGEDTVEDYIGYMKNIVDDYRLNPQDYKN